MIQPRGSPKVSWGLWPGLWLGMVLSAGILLIAGISLFWTPYSPVQMQMAPSLASPSFAHPFGADPYGRDVLSMVMAGSRNALGVAFAASVIGVGFGVPLGLLAAGSYSWTDQLVMRFSDLIFAFPALLIAVLLTAIWGPGSQNAALAIGVFNVPVFARVTRASALQHWTQDYVLAARMADKGRFRISLEHILPNLRGPLLIQGAIQLSLAVVADAGLAYVGLGAQPPAPSWGRMLAEGQTLVDEAPWLVMAPGLAIVLTVLALSLVGEGLRARLDLRTERGRS